MKAHDVAQLSMNSGSWPGLRGVEAMPPEGKARQMRLMVDPLSRAALGMSWVDQSVSRFGPAFQRAGQHLLRLPVAQLAGRARTRLIQETVEAAIQKALPPLAGGGLRTVLRARNLPCCLDPQRPAAQSARTHRQSLCRLRSLRPLLQLLMLCLFHGERKLRAIQPHRTCSSPRPTRPHFYLLLKNFRLRTLEGQDKEEADSLRE